MALDRSRRRLSSARVTARRSFARFLSRSALSCALSAPSNADNTSSYTVVARLGGPRHRESRSMVSTVCDLSGWFVVSIYHSGSLSSDSDSGPRTPPSAPVANPAAPVAPVKPMGPVDPLDPVDPVGPEDPVARLYSSVGIGSNANSGFLAAPTSIRSCACPGVMPIVSAT